MAATVQVSTRGRAKQPQKAPQSHTRPQWNWDIHEISGSQDSVQPPKLQRLNIIPRLIAKDSRKSSILSNIMDVRVDCRLARLNDTEDNLRNTNPGTGKLYQPRARPPTHRTGGLQLISDTARDAPLTEPTKHPPPMDPSGNLQSHSSPEKEPAPKEQNHRNQANRTPGIGGEHEAIQPNPQRPTPTKTTPS